MKEKIRIQTFALKECRSRSGCQWLQLYGWDTPLRRKPELRDTVLL
jgi:hypothetical protein